MTDQEFSLHLGQHLRHAQEKHQGFVNRLDSRRSFSIQQKLKQYRRLYEIHHTAYYALIEEVEEIFEALDRGKVPEAIYECFDAMAVLRRLVDKLEEKQHENSINR